MKKGHLIAMIPKLGNQWELSFDLKLRSGHGNIINLIHWDDNDEELRILFDVDIVASARNSLLKYSMNVIQADYKQHQIQFLVGQWSKFRIRCARSDHGVYFIFELLTPLKSHRVIHLSATSNFENLRLYAGDSWTGRKNDSIVAYLKNVNLVEILEHTAYDIERCTVIIILVIDFNNI